MGEIRRIPTNVPRCHVPLEALVVIVHEKDPSRTHGQVKCLYHTQESIPQSTTRILTMIGQRAYYYCYCYSVGSCCCTVGWYRLPSILVLIRSSMASSLGRRRRRHGYDMGLMELYIILQPFRSDDWCDGCRGGGGP